MKNWKYNGNLQGKFPHDSSLKKGYIVIIKEGKGTVMLGG